jgi:hypothetical protein
MPATKTVTKQKAEVKQETERRVIDKKEAKDIRNRAKGYIDNIEQSWFELSQLLVEIYDSEIYKTWSDEFTTFEKYCEQELGLSYRIALFRLNMGRSIVDFGIKQSQVEGLGWSKFKELCTLFTKDMAKEDVYNILKEVKTRKMTFAEVADYVRSQKVIRHGGENVKKVRHIFTLTEQQNDVVDEALKEAMSVASTDNTSLALEYICAEWLDSHNPAFAQKVLPSLQEHAAKAAVKAKHKEHANKGVKRAKKTKEASDAEGVGSE